MNVYDKTHDLAGALKRSSEYTRLLETKRVLFQDGAAKKLVEEFIKLQM